MVLRYLGSPSPNPDPLLNGNQNQTRGFTFGFWGGRGPGSCSTQQHPGSFTTSTISVKVRHTGDQKGSRGGLKGALEYFVGDYVSRELVTTSLQMSSRPVRAPFLSSDSVGGDLGARTSKVDGSLELRKPP
jgi:hypothetical protein